MTGTRRARTIARRLFLECATDAGVDEERARRVVLTIIESHRRHSLVVLKQLLRLVRLDRDRHRAMVESPMPLPAAERARLERALITRYGPGLRLTFTDEPGLIGGLRITVGSHIHDGSVRGRLAALADRF
jgi:F-type H+-transporting ATPase subunit delta